jgi:hypothetical protein
MKLRIRGDSIRLRLTQSEVAALATGDTVEETTRFGPRPQDHLSYRLSSSTTATNISADYKQQSICITLPAQEVNHWAATDAVGISAEQPTGPGRLLHILIEKDFACLTKREEDDGDAFPHPQESIRG